MAATLMACALVSTAYADGSRENVLVYPASYFADARPNTAYDMIGRLPGFTFDDGNTQRGFAGTAGNVLIDGQRPTSKTDDLQSVLARIPASDVDHIELIRGGTPGIDMQDHTVVANVIRKTADSTQIVAQADNNYWLGDHHSVPSAQIQYTKHTGDSTYEASIQRLGNYDDSVGKGSYTVLDPATGAMTRGGAHDSGRGAGTQMTGAATVPLFGGQFKANLSLQDSPFHDTLTYYLVAGNNYFKDDTGDQNAELGLHWIGNIGKSQLETLILQRLERDNDDSSAVVPGEAQVFKSENKTGETIARATLRYAATDTLNFEGGGEVAYNFLNGTSAYFDNSVLVPLPSANADVNEKRGELFGKGTWKFDPDWLLEVGARFEYSTITETGGTAQKRSFFYPKPRVVLTWDLDKDTQFRLRAERVLGQLDFGNFVATNSFTSSGAGVNAGNPDLKPDQHDQFEFAYEKHFWEKGAFSVTLMHEQIKDVVDYVPITNSSGTFDAPGNIGNGKNDQVDVEMTLPLDKIGLTNGLLKTTSIFRFSQVRDPVTGQNRNIAQYPQERPQDLEFTLTQDIDSLKSTWGLFYYNAWSEHYYRLTEVRSRRAIPPFVQAWWEYKPSSSLSLRAEVDNFIPFTYANQFDEYNGPRNLFPVAEVDTRRIKSQPRLYFQIRKTFD